MYNMYLAPKMIMVAPGNVNNTTIHGKTFLLPVIISLFGKKRKQNGEVFIKSTDYYVN